MPHGSLLEAYHHCPGQRWLHEDESSESPLGPLLGPPLRVKARGIRFHAVNGASLPLSERAIGSSARSSYSSFLAGSLTEEAFRKLDLLDAQKEEASIQNVPQQLAAGLGLSRGPRLEGIGMDNFITNVDVDSLDGPEAGSAADQGQGPGLEEEGPMGDPGVDMPLAMPAGKGGTTGTMLEYWSAEGPDGEGTQLLTDGEGHAVVKHTHHDSADHMHEERGEHHEPEHEAHDSHQEESSRHREHDVGRSEPHDHGSQHDSRSGPAAAPSAEPRHKSSKHYDESSRRSSERDQDTERHASDRDRDREQGRDTRDEDRDEERERERERDEDRGQRDDDRDGRDGDRDHDNPPPHPVIIINDDKDAGFQPTAVIGGLIAIFAQAYLWGNVFVTLFKPQRRAPADTASDSVGGPPGQPPRNVLESVAAAGPRGPPMGHRLDGTIEPSMQPQGRQMGGPEPPAQQPQLPPQPPTEPAAPAAAASSLGRFSGAVGLPGALAAQGVPVRS